jgi:hypothetical protein
MAGSLPTRFVVSRGPSSSVTTATTYGGGISAITGIRTVVFEYTVARPLASAQSRSRPKQDRQNGRG